MPDNKEIKNTGRKHKADDDWIIDAPDRTLDTEYSDLMQKSYIDYSMSVITARAVPDIRDGLKPVQRRVLYDMDVLGTTADKPYRKSARIVGDTMGKFHPHGDSSIYDSLVVMSQDFKKEAPLVDGHGNFGSIEGDGAAAMRYTESRLQPITQDAFLADLSENVVDFVPNFDENEKEPVVLPARFSNFLVNGSEGIAVGMTTSTPPHNLGEVIDATIALIKKPDMQLDELMEIIPGPDFPTGGIVANASELKDIYETGTGKIKIRGRAVIEKGDAGRERIVITEIPYTMIGANIGKFLNDTASLSEDRITTDIADISNQSSKDGMRIVIELKKGADAKNVLNILYAKTKLEDTFGVNMLAISDNVPVTLGLKDAIMKSIDFQYEILTRKYESLLNKALGKSEIEEGLITACDVIDAIIEMLRGSKDRKQAKTCMTTGNVDNITFRTKEGKKTASIFHFTERQADAILDMRLHRLIGLEIEQLQKEHQKTLKEIERCNEILSNRNAMSKQIIKDLNVIKDKYARPRRTEIKDLKAPSFTVKSAEGEAKIVIIDKLGYVHAVDENTYEKNKAAAKEIGKFITKADAGSKVLIFTSSGTVSTIAFKDIKMGKLRDKGAPVDTLCDFDSRKDNILLAVSVSELLKAKLFMCTKYGFIKLMEGSEFDIAKRNFTISKFKDDDSIVSLDLYTDQQYCVMTTKNGWCLKINTDTISVQKRNSVGITGIKLAKNDSISKAFLYGANGSLFATAEEIENANKLKTAGRATKGVKIK